jgi:hypothetical protein
LQTCPQESLIVVEEIELGLHQEAQRKLAAVLQEIALKKRLQVVVSTHSEHFLAALPPEARQLVTRAGDQHTVIAHPTARYAMCQLDGLPKPELHVYCEDSFAAELVSCSLGHRLKQRVGVFDVGSDSSLPGVWGFHKRIGLDERALILWDGDVTDQQAHAHIRKHLSNEDASDARFNWSFLPGESAPEEWALAQLRTAEGLSSLATVLQADQSDARVVVDAMAASGDHHDICFALAQQACLEFDDARRRIAAAVAAIPSDPLAAIRRAIEQVLLGDHVQGRST